MRKLRTFLALPWAERLAFIEAWAWVWASLVCLRALGLQGTLARWPAMPLAGAEGAPPRAARWIRIAARYAPGADTCLVRSVALVGVLRRHGIAAELRVGARRVPSGIEAHAWVERRGEPLDDAADVAERFAPFPALPAALPRFV